MILSSFELLFSAFSNRSTFSLQVPEITAQDENAFAGKKTAKTFGVQAQQFSVFVDEPVKKPTVKGTKVSSLSSVLPESLTSLPSSRLPLSAVPCSPDIICLDDSAGKTRPLSNRIPCRIS